jgi:hypothetical protein
LFRGLLLLAYEKTNRDEWRGCVQPCQGRGPASGKWGLDTALSNKVECETRHTLVNVSHMGAGEG